jgi:large subunit ribosomal protein L18
MVTALGRRLRLRRKFHVRQKIRGTPQRPRLNVFRSNKHICAQVIDDDAGRTLAAACTAEAELRAKLPRGSNKEAARAVGALVARRVLEKGIAKVVLDRNGYLYHGRVRALAEGAREAGLEF